MHSSMFYSNKLFYFQTIRLSRCYKSKMKAINKGLAMLREKTQKDAEVVSRQCLELLINAILLDLQTGRPSIALRRFDQIRLSGNSSGATSVDAPTSNFKGTVRYHILLMFQCLD